MGREYRIAFKARLYRLLSERPEYMAVGGEELIGRLLSAQVPLGELDKTLVLGASELDRVCAHAVRVLSNVSDRPLLDALGMMDADRIIAVYHALPPKRRAVVLRDPVWAYHVANAPPETPAAVAEVAADAQEGQALTSSGPPTNVAPGARPENPLQHWNPGRVSGGTFLDDPLAGVVSVRMSPP
jgi:hypothetical protein